MSLILDALRKSEAERRRGQLPALTLELPPAPSRRARSRAWWLLAPLALALVAVAYFGTRSPDVPPSQAESGPEQFVLPGTGPTQAFEPVPVPADARPAAVEVVDTPPVVAAPPPVAPTPAPAVAIEVDPAGSPGTPLDATPGAPPVLALSELGAAERQALPPLKLSMHMWSADPARRFAIIDGHRVTEGDRVGTAVVERIEPAGVILAADGRRIRLPLP